jgi:hypothetical protein
MYQHKRPTELHLNDSTEDVPKASRTSRSMNLRKRPTELQTYVLKTLNDKAQDVGSSSKVNEVSLNQDKRPAELHVTDSEEDIPKASRPSRSMNLRKRPTELPTHVLKTLNDKALDVGSSSKVNEESLNQYKKPAELHVTDSEEDIPKAPRTSRSMNLRKRPTELQTYVLNTLNDSVNDKPQAVEGSSKAIEETFKAAETSTSGPIKRERQSRARAQSKRISKIELEVSSKATVVTEISDGHSINDEVDPSTLQSPNAEDHSLSKTEVSSRHHEEAVESESSGSCTPEPKRSKVEHK